MVLTPTELVMQQAVLIGVPVLVFANKQDLTTALSSEEIESRLQIHSSQPIRIMSLSALTGYMIEYDVRLMENSEKGSVKVYNG